MDLYDAIGGDAAVQVISADLARRVMTDPALAPSYLQMRPPEVVERIEALLLAALRGPEQLPTFRPIAVPVTVSDFDAFMAHLVDALTAINLPSYLVIDVGSRLLPLRDTTQPAPTRTPHRVRRSHRARA